MTGVSKLCQPLMLFFQPWLWALGAIATGMFEENARKRRSLSLSVLAVSVGWRSRRSAASCWLDPGTASPVTVVATSLLLVARRFNRLRGGLGACLPADQGRAQGGAAQGVDGHRRRRRRRTVAAHRDRGGQARDQPHERPGGHDHRHEVVLAHDRGGRERRYRQGDTATSRPTVPSSSGQRIRQVHRRRRAGLGVRIGDRRAARRARDAASARTHNAAHAESARYGSASAWPRGRSCSTRAAVPSSAPGSTSPRA